MAAEKKGVDQTFTEILEKKSNYGVDTDSMLALLCLVNTMKIIELISEEDQK